MALDAEFIKKQKETLLKEKNRAEVEIKKLKKYPQYGEDEEDNLQELADYESNLIIDTNFEDLLGKINTALGAIDNATYGQCTKCQKAIEENRLKAIPWAEVCMECNKGKKK